jgi:hypothetical protein
MRGRLVSMGSSKRPSGRRRAPIKREPDAIKAARIGGRYAIAAAIVGAVIAALFTNGFGLVRTSSPTATTGSVSSINSHGLGQWVELGGPVLQIMVVQGWMSCTDITSNGWVFPEPPDQIAQFAPGTGPKRDRQTWDQDPSAFGAVPAAQVGVIIEATGRVGQPAIVLTGIRVHVLQRKPPVGGTRLNIIPEGCGGQGSGLAHYGLYDLDRLPTYTVPSSALRDIGEKYGQFPNPLEFPYAITFNEPQEVIIDITMEHCDCRWEAILDWSQGSRSGHMLITDHGKPFETTSWQNVQSYDWSLSTNNEVQRTRDPLRYPSACVLGGFCKGQLLTLRGQGTTPMRFFVQNA